MNLLVTLLLAASAFDSTFDEGVTAYHNGDFDLAIQRFETLVQQDVSTPEVFYNLGNAYYRTSQLAAAIANYERALRLDPGNEDIRYNLDRARSRTERVLPRPASSDWEQTFFFWHSDWPASRSRSVAAATWIFAWCLLALRFFRRWPYLNGAIAVSFAFALLFVGSWWVKSHPDTLAVASRNDVQVRFGHRSTEAVRFKLHEGDSVRVDARQDGWARVETHDGERGWTEESNLYFVGPPYSSFARSSTPFPGVGPRPVSPGRTNP